MTLSQSLQDQPLRLPRVVAIDGPSASGKGTLARRLAADLGYIYVDSGAMYRTLAWWTLQNGLRSALPLKPTDEAAIVRLLRRWKTEVRIIDGEAWLHVNGYFPALEIRSNPVEAAVPAIAQISKVRDWMVARQRACTDLGPLVMEGRDIGTEVFPLAEVKIFLHADEVVRQARLANRGNAGSNGFTRDHLDNTRKKGALYPALDAFRIDNSAQTPDETFQLLRSHVRSRLRFG